MNFGQALALLKMGERVAREGWNGKGMWLVLVVPHAAVAEGGKAPASALVRLAVGTMPWRDVDGSQTEVQVSDWLGAGPNPDSERVVNSPRLMSFIGMKTADNGFVPWLASQMDLLAEDWILVA